jgi:hypothetical protein
MKRKKAGVMLGWGATETGEQMKKSSAISSANSATLRFVPFQSEVLF